MGTASRMEKRQLGGIGFLIGNAALFFNGLIANCHAPTAESRKAGAGRMVSSALWGGSSAFLATYGDRPVEAQQTRLEEKLASYLQQHGVPLDAQTLRKADADQRHGWFTKVEDFFYAHPIECTNAYYTLAATGFAVSGALRRKDGNIKAGNANIGVGALVLAGALASILIPEKTHEQVEAQGQAGTLWGKIQEHPLGYVRWLFLSADAMIGMQAVGEYQAAKALPKGDGYRQWQFGMAGLSATAMGMAMTADYLTSGSKKAGGTPEAREGAQAQLLAAAGKQLASMPAAEREAIIQTVAQYLSKQPELRLYDRTAEQLAADLRQRVDSALPAQNKAVLGQHTAQLQEKSALPLAVLQK